MKEKINIKLVDRRHLFHLFMAEVFQSSLLEEPQRAEYNAREDMEGLLGNEMC